MKIKIDRRTMYLVSESQLKPLPKGNALRTELELELRQAVIESIEIARAPGNSLERKEEVTLLLDALTARPQQRRNSFALWAVRRGRLIGTRKCYEIGTHVCELYRFTIKEAAEILANTQWEKSETEHTH